MHIQCHFNKQDGDFGSRAVSDAVVLPRLCIQLLLLLTTRWQTCYAPPPSAPLPSAEPNGMWRTVPYSNAAGRKKGFHNLLFLLGERRKRRRWGNGKWTKQARGEKEMEKRRGGGRANGWHWGGRRRWGLCGPHFWRGGVGADWEIQEE